MKKLIAIVTLIFLLMATACSSGGGASTGGGTPSTPETTKGATVENDIYSVLMPDSWSDHFEFEDGTIQIIESADSMIQLKMMGDNVAPKENEELFNYQMEMYDATFIDNMTIAGVDCIGAMYEFNDYDYIQYQGIINGKQFSVMLLHLDPTEDIVQDILNSIVIK